MNPRTYVRVITTAALSLAVTTVFAQNPPASPPQAGAAAPQQQPGRGNQTPVGQIPIPQPCTPEQIAAASQPPAPGAGRGGGRGGGPTLSPEEASALEKGGQIYAELCFSCHGTDGLGAPKAGTVGTMAPPLAGSPRVNGHRDYIIKTVLYGMTGPIDGKTYS